MQAWLIEHTATGKWWGHGQWVKDPSTALRFATEKQAEIGLDGLRKESPTIFRDASPNQVKWREHPNLPGRTFRE